MADDYVAPTLEQLLDAFEGEINAAVAAQSARGKGGQQVPSFCDFVSAGPSTLSRLRWWLREFRSAHKREAKE